MFKTQAPAISPTDVAAFDELTAPMRSLVYYGFKSLLNEVNRIQLATMLNNTDSPGLMHFYNNVAYELEQSINVLEDMEHDNNLSLITHFSKPIP